MSATVFFDAARQFKRDLTGLPIIGLTDEDVAMLNAATVARWKPVAPETVAKAITEPQAFFGAVRAFTGALAQPQIDGFNVLLSAMGAARWPIAWAAYGLATAWHETARTMQPIKEYGGPSYYRRMYDIQGGRPAKARELGNLSPGDGVKYAGRGFVQLTGKRNYSTAGEHVGCDLEGNPDLAMGCDIAARILIWGMETGAFTSKRLADYLPIDGNAGFEAFKAARRIINGQDRADDIAKLAVKFQDALAAGEWA